MEQKDIKQLVEALEPLLEQKIKESHSAGLESGGKEVSNLADSVLKKVTAKLDESHNDIKLRLERIDEKQAVANGYVAKHEQRLNNQDIMNAQTTISQQQTANSLATLIASDKANTEDRIGRNGFNVRMQWILGFIGFGTFALVAKYIFKAF